MPSASSSAATKLVKISLEDRVAGLEVALAGQGLRPLIQQVAWVLFFEYEKLPTGNNIYALLKQGSMTTYGSEVGVFWDNIREQVKEVQGIANIPDPLAKEISRSMGGVWRLALALAAEEARRPQKKQDARLEVLTPLSRLSAEMNEIKAERDTLRGQVLHAETFRLEREALKEKLLQNEAMHAKEKKAFEKRERKLKKDLTLAASRQSRSSPASTSINTSVLSSV